VTARDLGATRKNLNGPIHSSPWNGRKADQFRQRWDHEYARNIREAARFLEEHADILRRQANEQRQASRAYGSNGARGTRLVNSPVCELPNSQPDDFWDFLADFGPVTGLGRLAEFAGIPGIAANLMLAPFAARAKLMMYAGKNVIGGFKGFATWERGWVAYRGVKNLSRSIGGFLDGGFISSGRFAKFAPFVGSATRVLGGLGVAIDGYQAFNHFRKGNWEQGGISAAKAIGGAMMFAPPPVNVIGGVVVAGAYAVQYRENIANAGRAVGRTLSGAATKAGRVAGSAVKKLNPFD